MNAIGIFIATAILAGRPVAQEGKPVPKDSVRVSVPGCSKGFIFTAGPRAEDGPGDNRVPAGMHLRMNGPKPMMAEIKGQGRSRIEITGLVKKGQVGQDGVGLGGGVRVSGGSPPSGGSLLPTPGAGQIMIDVESWRRIPGECPSR